MKTEKTSLEAESQPSCLAAVIRCLYYEFNLKTII
jgi:hypothetical protein